MRNYIIGLALAVFSLAGTAIAQETRGTILGRVTDSSGAVIAGATIRATNTATNVTVSTESNAEGNYEVPFLLPGIYRVTSELAGFKTFIREGIEVRIADRITIAIALDVISH